MTSERHPTRRELLEGAIHTIESVLMPELRSDWARSCALGLVGQLRYALTRATGDSLARQDEQLRECLDGLARQFAELRAIAGAVEDGADASWALRERAGRMLVFAVGRECEAAAAVRARLRPLLVAQVAEDLAESHPMLQAFLASGSLGSTG